MLYEQRDGVFAENEKVHVIEHRRFESDLRRHFVGEVHYYDSHYLRVAGNLYMFNGSTGLFEKVPPSRTRVFANDNRISITVLPSEFDLETAEYSRIGGDLAFVDKQGLCIEIGVFGTNG